MERIDPPNCHVQHKVFSEVKLRGVIEVWNTRIDLNWNNGISRINKTKALSNSSSEGSLMTCAIQALQRRIRESIEFKSKVIQEHEDKSSVNTLE